jgi:hypothetical protein
MNGAEVETQALDDFSRRLVGPELSGVTGAAPLAQCGSGLKECQDLTTAEAEARQEATRFLTEEAQGFEAYKSVVGAARDEYIACDERGAQAVAMAFDAAPEELR